MRDLNLEGHGRVGLAFPSGNQYVAALIGVMKAGLPVIPLNTQFTPPEMEAFLAQVQPQAVICDEVHAELMQAAGVSTYIADFGSSGLTLRRCSQLHARRRCHSPPPTTTRCWRSAPAVRQGCPKVLS